MNAHTRSKAHTRACAKDICSVLKCRHVRSAATKIPCVNLGTPHRRRLPKAKIADSGTTRPIAMHQKTIYGRFV